MKTMVHIFTRESAYCKPHPENGLLYLVQFHRFDHYHGHNWHAYSRDRFMTFEEWSVRLDAEIIAKYGYLPGVPLSQLSGRLGDKGYDKFKSIAESWGYP